MLHYAVATFLPFSLEVEPVSLPVFVPPELAEFLWSFRRVLLPSVQIELIITTPIKEALLGVSSYALGLLAQDLYKIF